MSSNNPIRRSMARVEFLACMDDVESMLEQGFSKQLIYERLKETSQISMAYVTFAKFIVKAAQSGIPLKSTRPTGNLVASPASTSAAETEQAIPTLPQRQSGIIRAESKTFPDPRTMDANDSY